MKRIRIWEHLQETGYGSREEEGRGNWKGSHRNMLCLKSSFLIYLVHYIMLI